MARLDKNSQPFTTRPSELQEGQFLSVVHDKVHYTFTHDYGYLDLIIGRDGSCGEEVVAFRFNDGGLGIEVADQMWSDLMTQFSDTPVWEHDPTT